MIKKSKVCILIAVIQLFSILTAFADTKDLGFSLGKYGTFVSDNNLTIDNALVQKELPQDLDNQILYLNLTTNEIDKSFLYTVKLYDISERVLLATKYNVCSDICLSYNISNNILGHSIGVTLTAESGNGYVYAELLASDNKIVSEKFDEITDIDYISTNCSDWAQTYIQTARSLKILPNELDRFYTCIVNREDFCHLAYNLLNHMEEIDISEQTHIFEDVNCPQVDALYAMGVISGYDNQSFMPNRSITREEAAIILKKITKHFQKLPLTDERNIYNDDCYIDNWAKDSVYVMQQLNIMTGTDNNNFSPHSNYTKEQAIVTIMRLYNILNKK